MRQTNVKKGVGAIIRDMKFNHKLIVAIVVGAVSLSALLIWTPRVVEYVSISMAAKACDVASDDENIKDTCFVEVSLAYMRDGNIPAAYRAFDYLYDTYPEFGAWGCHINAHRLGDAAYYEFFVTHGLQLSQMDFPQRTTSCGYGFFHGFLEHLIQEHPRPEYIKQTCEYLRDRLSTDMRDIARICYHASGHGLIQAMADVLEKSQWGDVVAMVTPPVLKCESMSGISELDIEECREGVFNVVSGWMITNDFGTEFDYEDPFAVCDLLPARWHEGCYYEFGQKLSPVIKDKVLVAETFVSTIPEKILREETFGVIVAGMMERLAPLDTYTAVFEDCAQILDDDLFNVCVRSATNGMMEHGSPGNEYKKILPMCALPMLEMREGTAICYKALSMRLSRFYPPAKKADVCNVFPDDYKEACMMTP